MAPPTWRAPPASGHVTGRAPPSGLRAQTDTSLLALKQPRPPRAPPIGMLRVNPGLGVTLNERRRCLSGIISDQWEAGGAVRRAGAAARGGWTGRRGREQRPGEGRGRGGARRDWGRWVGRPGKGAGPGVLGAERRWACAALGLRGKECGLGRGELWGHGMSGLGGVGVRGMGCRA